MSRHEGEHLAMWIILLTAFALALFATVFVLVADMTFDDEVETIACAGTRIECKEETNGP